MRRGYEPIKDDKGNEPSYWDSFLAIFSPSRTTTESANITNQRKATNSKIDEKNIFSSYSNESANLTKNKK